MARRLPLVLARLFCVLFAFVVFGHTADAALATPTLTSAKVTKVDQSFHYLLQVTGTNFVPTSGIVVNGTTIQATYLSPTSMQITIGVSVGATSINVAIATQGSNVWSNTLAVPISDAFLIQVVGSSTVRLQTTTTFAAAFGPGAPANRAITWSVNGIVGGNSTVGTITSAGLYTPPLVLPAAGTVTIGAVSAAAPAVNNSMVVSLWNPYPQVGARTATKQGNTLTYLVDLQGTGFMPVSVMNFNGAALATKYISSTEIQANVVVPAGSTQITVSVSQPNPGAVSSVSYVMPVSQAVAVTVAGPTTPRLATVNTYTASVAGISNTQVTWQVNGVTGGTAATGFITAAGVYTAPLTLPATPVTITAISVAATQCSGSVALSLQNSIPVISSASATQTAGATSFPIDIRGTGFTPNSVISANGSAISTTYVAATELKGNLVVQPGASSAPLTVANPAPGAAVSNSYTLKFTSVAVTAAAASRLLDQASMGPTVATIQHVQQVGLSGYLNEQFATPATLFTSISPSPLPITCRVDGNPYNCAESDFWRVSVSGQDQLRQRVAFALSEIFVISMPSVYGPQVPSFYNTLTKDAFGNFSTLIKDVTLTQAMGTYLNMSGSAVPPTGQITNENYAREMMQLFTIGPYLLNQDGTQQLSSAGKPIPTYTQDQVQAFARAFTGWTVPNNDGSLPTHFPNGSSNFDAPMAPYEAAHDHSAKILLNGVTLPAGQTATQDLDGAISDVLAHPNVGPFICRQLIQHLVTGQPSPAYVARVSAVFANNGSGVRGDLKAVITAILMDTEARAGDNDPTVNSGHLREPILLTTNMARAFGFTNNASNGTWMGLSGVSMSFGERPLAASSVFGYFRPDYMIPDTQLNGPEFGIENTANATLRMNALNLIPRNNVNGFNVDISAFVSLAAYPPDVVDTLGALLMHAQMPADMRTVIINAITPITDNTIRARVAIYLVLNSPQYLVMH